MKNESKHLNINDDNFGSCFEIAISQALIMFLEVNVMGRLFIVIWV